MSWKLNKFKDIIEFNPRVNLKKGEVYDFIQMSSIDGNYKFATLIEEKKYNGGGAKFENGDTLFARITPCLEHGKIVKAKNLKGKGFGSTEYFIFRAKEGISDPEFIYYLAKSDTITQPAIKSMVGASGRQRADKGVVEELEINLPPLPTQKKIASILSAYDDLIENNLKRIKLLEEAAQHLYKEWFVNFRFPGSETTPINQETGLPEGWEKVSMLEIMDISGGGTPSTRNKSYWEGGEILWFSPTDLSKNNSLILTDSARKITGEGLKNSSAKLLPPMTILMSSRATIGLFGLINKPCSTNQGFINIIPKNDNFRYYILFNLMYRKAEIEGHASGATFKELSKRSFKQLEINVPNDELASTFYKIISNFLKQVENLENQNNKLKEARELLLPRLMNRTIEV